MGRPPTNRDDVTVKLDRTIVERAKLVALRRRVSLVELLTDLLRGPVDKAYDQEVRRLASEGKGE